VDELRLCSRKVAAWGNFILRFSQLLHEIFQGTLQLEKTFTIR